MLKEINKIPLRKENDRMLNILSILTVIFCCILCSILCFHITLVFIDDVMYGNWMRHGFKYFIEQNIWHMKNFNGRIFVHICVQAVTLFSENLYAILAPIFLFVIFAGFFKTLRPNTSIKSLMFATSIGMIMFLSLGTDFLTPTLMWISGSFNYIFPLFFIAISYTLFLKNKEKEKTSIATIILLFLSGATTEQYGMFTIGLIVLTLFFDFLSKNKIKRNTVAYLLPAIIGYLTVMLSPSTFARMEASSEFSIEQEISVIEVIFNNFFLLFQPQKIINVGIIFFILIGTVAIVDKEKYSKQCKIGLPLGLILILMNIIFPINLNYIFYIIGFCTIAYGLCKNEKTREQGKLLICGFGTFIMLCITIAAGKRTAVPFVLCLLIICTTALYDLSKYVKNKKIKIIAIFILISICFTLYLPDYKNYAKREQFCEEIQNQLSTSNETGVINLNFDELLTDKNNQYRYSTIFDSYSQNQLAIYQEYFNIPKDVKVHIYSEQYNVSNVSHNNKYLFRPIVHKDNKTYVPIELLQIIPPSNKIDFSEYEFEFEIQCYYGGKCVFIEIEEFCETVGFKYEYNKESNTYVFDYNETGG